MNFMAALDKLNADPVAKAEREALWRQHMDDYARVHRDMVSAVDEVYHSGKDDVPDFDKFYETYGNFVRELRKEDDRRERSQMAILCGVAIGIVLCAVVALTTFLW